MCHKNSHSGPTNIDLASKPVATLGSSRLFFSIPSRSNLPFLISLPFFPNYRVNVAAAQRERGEHARTRRPVAVAPREQRGRTVRAERARVTFFSERVTFGHQMGFSLIFGYFLLLFSLVFSSAATHPKYTPDSPQFWHAHKGTCMPPRSLKRIVEL